MAAIPTSMTKRARPSGTRARPDVNSSHGASPQLVLTAWMPLVVTRKMPLLITRSI
jgi:hypothetical protein